MRDQIKLVIAATVTILFLTASPNLWSIINTHSVTPTPDHSLDSAFIPKLTSNELQLKRILLLDQIQSLKNGSSCIGSGDNVCQHLKEQYKILLADANKAYDIEAEKCLQFETKWNTICQIWKNDTQRLQEIRATQQKELKNNSNKIQTMGNQIIKLKTQIKNIKPCQEVQPCKECPETPGGNIVCPTPLPCPSCDKKCLQCKQCQECPNCEDQEYQQLHIRYTDLYRQFEKCEAQVEDYHKKSQTSQDCGQIQSTINERLKRGIHSLSQFLVNKQIGSDALKRELGKAIEKLQTSEVLQQTVSVIPTVLNTLSKQLQDLSIKSKQKEAQGQSCQKCGQGYSQIHNECMNSFKKAVDKLKNCEHQLSPFLAVNKK